MQVIALLELHVGVAKIFWGKFIEVGGILNGETSRGYWHIDLIELKNYFLEIFLHTYFQSVRFVLWPRGIMTKIIHDTSLEAYKQLEICYTLLAGGWETSAGGNAAPCHSAEYIRETEGSEAPPDGYSCCYKKPGTWTWNPKVARMKWQYGEQI